MTTNKRLLGLMAMAMVAMLAITACDPQTTGPAEDPVSLYTEVEALTSFELLGAPDTFDDATMDSELRQRPNPRHKDSERGGRSVGHHPYGKLLRALDLNERQQAAAKELLMAHRDCVKEAIMLYREHMKELFQRAREARRGIIEQYRNGEITREEAIEMIRAQNLRLRDYLQNSDVRQRVREMLEDCDNQFLRGLSQILDEEQMMILERWLMARDDRASDREDDGDKRGNSDKRWKDKRGDKDDKDRDNDDDEDDAEDDDDDSDDEEDDEEDDDAGNGRG